MLPTITLEHLLLSAALLAITLPFFIYRKELWLAWDCQECGTRWLVKPTFFTRTPRSELAEAVKGSYQDERGRLLCGTCLQAEASA